MFLGVVRVCCDFMMLITFKTSLGQDEVIAGSQNSTQHPSLTPVPSEMPEKTGEDGDLSLYKNSAPALFQTVVGVETKVNE